MVHSEHVPDLFLSNIRHGKGSWSCNLCNFAWEFVCNKTGALFKQLSIVIPVTSEEEIADQFWRGVTPHTKIIFISHITSPTSLTMPVEMICQRARQPGTLPLIDGAHAPGQMPVDLDAIQADFYV